MEAATQVYSRAADVPHQFGKMQLGGGGAGGRHHGVVRVYARLFAFWTEYHPSLLTITLGQICPVF